MHTGPNPTPPATSHKETRFARTGEGNSLRSNRRPSHPHHKRQIHTGPQAHTYTPTEPKRSLRSRGEGNSLRSDRRQPTSQPASQALPAHTLPEHSFHSHSDKECASRSQDGPPPNASARGTSPSSTTPGLSRATEFGQFPPLATLGPMRKAGRQLERQGEPVTPTAINC